MANIAIKDTGYATVESTGTVETTKANSGTAITLYNVSLNFSRDANIDDKSAVGTWAKPKVNQMGFEAATIVVDGVVDRTSTTDMDLIDELDMLTRTKGIKCLYYDSSSDGYRDITDSMGYTDAYTNHPTQPHFHTRAKSFSIKQTADSRKLRYTLTLIETS